MAPTATTTDTKATLRKQLEALRARKKGNPKGVKIDIEAFRAVQREAKNTSHRKAAAIFIPRPEDTVRRDELEQDVYLWLPHYLPHVFIRAFQPLHREMIEAILRAATYAGDQAIAAPRAQGKTTTAEGVSLFCMLKGLVTFGVIFAATGSDAENSLNSIKSYIIKSDTLLADYPELCVPAREVRTTPAKAKSMWVYGEDFSLTEAFFQWSGRDISFPDVPGFRSAQSRFSTRGLDAAFRGLKEGTRRPQLAIIDDPDTEGSAASEEQTAKLVARIERAIAGLAPTGERISRVLLTTLQNRTCASAQFTDSTVKPSWNGKRFKWMEKFPDREDMWEEYITFRQRDMSEGDPFARKAHAFYLEHREEMDAGAELCNPFSYDARILPDGSALQVSALQYYYDFVADNGVNAALCELQNDPPEESGPVESGITAHRVMRQVGGYPRRIIPPGVECITQGIDIGKYNLHWVVKAWRADATAYVIDYGVQETSCAIKGTDEATDKAILRALYTRREFLLANPYQATDGELIDIKKTLIDASYRENVIYHFCREAGVTFEPAMGQPNFRPVVRVSKTKQPGDGWFRSLQEGGTWLVGMDTDRWKGWEHDRWMTPPDMPGTCLLYGDRGQGDRLSPDQKKHMSFSKHITAEIETEVPTKDKGMVRRWKVKSDTNHYLDASYMADVAANMSGISLLAKPKSVWVGRPSLAELAKRGRK